MNREEATERFAGLLRGALARRRPRKKTGIPAGVRKKRLDDKRRRSQLKSSRARPVDDD